MYKGIYEAIKYASSKKMFTLIASNEYYLIKAAQKILTRIGFLKYTLVA